MNIKPLAKLTRLLSVLLKVNIGLLIAGVVAGIYGWIEYSRLDPKEDVSETLLKSDIASSLVGLAQLFVIIFVGITFLRWIYRANKNLHFLSSETMTFSPGWSVGWYFIPIGNLYKPYQAMKEIWSAAHRGAAHGGSLLGWWWGLWIVSNFLGHLALRLALRANDAQGQAYSAAVYVGSDVLDIGLNLVSLKLVSAITKAYTLNYVEQPDAGTVGTAVCAECRETFNSEDMIRVGSHIVCAKCKPIFMQKLAEGVVGKGNADQEG